MNPEDNNFNPVPPTPAPTPEPVQPAAAQPAQPAPEMPHVNPMTQAINPVKPVAPTPAPAQPEASQPMGATPFGATPMTPVEPTPTAEAPAEAPKMTEPIRPAAPVPGSIGSAMPNPMPNPNPMTNAQAPSPFATASATTKPEKKKSKTTLILAIVAILLILPVGAYFILNSMGILDGLFAGNKKEEEKPEVIVKPTLATLTCSLPADKTRLTALGEAKTAKEVLTAEYYNNDLSEIALETEAEYTTTDAANFGMELLEKEYNLAIKTAGLDMTKDPFTTTKDVKDFTITYKHAAGYDKLTLENGVLFRLVAKAQTEEEVAEGVEKELDTSLEAIKTTYTTAGFTCVSE